MSIDQSQWANYLEELSRQADGYETAIEIMSGELGDQVEVRRAPLLEVAFDAREGISVSVGSAAGHAEVLRHVVAAPTRLQATDEPGVPAALMIEDAGGTRTLLRLTAPEPDAGA